MDPANAIAAFIVWYPITVAIASAICALTPTPKDDSALKKIRAVLDVLALNIGHSAKK